MLHTVGAKFFLVAFEENDPLSAQETIRAARDWRDYLVSSTAFQSRRVAHTR